MIKCAYCILYLVLS